MIEANYKLVEPSTEYETAFYKMADDYFDNGEFEYPKYFNPKSDTFADFLTRVSNYNSGILLEEGYLPSVTFWLVDSSMEIFGTIRYREELNKFTKIDGGNIGFDVPPSKRNNGYATLMLALLIKKLRPQRKSRLLITVEDDNAPSIRVVEKNGGLLEDTTISHRTKKIIRRYYIQITS